MKKYLTLFLSALLFLGLVGGGPCIEELPELQKLSEAYADKDVAITGLYFSEDGLSDEERAEVESVLKNAGALFSWKLAILVAVVVLSMSIYRPFCRYLCPLGAIYGIFNRFSLYRYQIDTAKCTRGGPINVDAEHNPNSAECIRKQNCPTAAIQATFPPLKHESKLQNLTK